MGLVLTRAVFGNTNDHHVIWNGMPFRVRRYFQSDPIETRKNHMERPQNQRATRMEIILIMSALFSVPRKSGGKISRASLPSCALKKVRIALTFFSLKCES
jgi:hypothetical protein